MIFNDSGCAFLCLHKRSQRRFSVPACRFRCRKATHGSYFWCNWTCRKAQSVFLGVIGHCQRGGWHQGGVGEKKNSGALFRGLILDVFLNGISSPSGSQNGAKIIKHVMKKRVWI